eukprot:CAMPEP_0172396738 /NCGR_PEP_ID=MMETSP1061-20121228/26743_1 /TAXON_ID=37318 /ORGANISM="Pseudo-nitzschia pungens, Strain cf. pungens" /LENGTH=267 /DNA_ID=CAMNT_0013128683 /DNA_START=194 /DNA_END=997 /DNA_ORIENTATION=+
MSGMGPTINRRDVIPSLDLHGCEKEVAVSRTTIFLDETCRKNNAKNGWVKIITGTGAHSPDGPVLRGAIKALLQKREMEFRMTEGKGSFLVNAVSGIVLYDPPQPTDSKVVVAPNWSSRSANNVIRRIITEGINESKKELKKNFHNRANEKAAMDKALAKSLEETRKRNEEEKHANEQLERALSVSRLDELKEREEEARMKEALENSKRELIEQSIDEEELIRRAMEESMLEEERMMILRESISSHSHNSQEDEELLEVFERSVIEF